MNVATDQQTTDCALTSTSTATPRCGWACRCRRSRTRCTTRSASGRSPRSSVSPTSTAWCWRPISPGRLIRIRCACCASCRPTGGAQVPLAGIATITRTSRAAGGIRHQAQFPSVTLSFDLAPGLFAGQGGGGGRTQAEQSIGMPETITGNSFRAMPRSSNDSLRPRNPG